MIAPAYITGVGTPTSDDDAVNKKYVDDLIPPGVIVMWSGANVPDGWALCDGTNGTPDLRDRFVLGVGNNYSLGDTGGSETVTLTADQMPKHRHQYYDYTSDNIKYSSGSTSAYVSSATSAIRLTDISGKDQPHPNMPPYYALYYIMKL